MDAPSRSFSGGRLQVLRFRPSYAVGGSSRRKAHERLLLRFQSLEAATTPRLLERAAADLSSSQTRPVRKKIELPPSLSSEKTCMLSSDRGSETAVSLEETVFLH